MRRKAIAIAVSAAAVLTLAGCSSGHAGPTIEWKASAACRSPSSVGATADLSQAAFTVKSATSETPANGCSYLASGGKTELNVDVIPGTPSNSVQFGDAAALTTKKLPQLGSGAEAVSSATFCTLLAPATGGNTIQIQVEGADLTAACGRLTNLLNEFATQTTSAS